MERSVDAITRSNAVIALGDMAVCFNHLIDENTDFLYRRLDDNDSSVKRTCLMTLTFLILAGQVKVKGQLGEMAKCLEDSDKRIVDLSRMFFTELATKDNAIYNHFVDMFSLLSAEKDLEEDKLKRIIKFLASFIEKVYCLVAVFGVVKADGLLPRINTRSSCLRSWRQGCRDVKLSGNGTMLLMLSRYCNIRMRIYRRRWLVVLGWCKLRLEIELVHGDLICIIIMKFTIDNTPGVWFENVSTYLIFLLNKGMLFARLTYTSMELALPLTIITTQIPCNCIWFLIAR
jgi:hypothetical protein